MKIKWEYILILVIIFFGLHLLMIQCNCEKFSVGIVTKWQLKNESTGEIKDSVYAEGIEHAIEKFKEVFDEAVHIIVEEVDTGGGAAGSAAAAGGDEVIILDLMTPATREYLSGSGSNWITTTMDFKSALDKYLLICIQALITSRGGDTKQVVFVGQAYFILQSLFFTNSTLIFFDINIHLLEAMRNIINSFKKTFFSIRTWRKQLKPLKPL